MRPERSSRGRSGWRGRTSCSPSTAGRRPWFGRLHERFFYRPLLESFAGPATPRPGRDREATQELLAGLGFGRPAAAYEVLARLVDPSTHLGKVLAHVFPVMAPALALASDPDAALVRLERVIAASGGTEQVADALANDPGMARRLAHVVAASGFSTDLLSGRPELLLALREGVETDDTQAAAPRRRGTVRGARAPAEPHG